MERYVVFVISMRREEGICENLQDMVKKSCTVFDFFQRELVPSSEEFRGGLRVDWYTKSRGCYYCFREEGCLESTIVLLNTYFTIKTGAFSYIAYCRLYISYRNNDNNILSPKMV